MRSLIILRGPRESGRRSFARKAGLMPWMVDQDAIESLFNDMIMNEHGQITPDPMARRRGRAQLNGILTDKMAKGALIVFRPGDIEYPSRLNDVSGNDKIIQKTIEMARLYRYAIHIIDFTHQKSAEDLIQRRARAGLTDHPGQAQKVLSHMDRVARTLQHPDVTWHLPAAAALRLPDLYEPAPLNLDPWPNLVAIGDIHGCINTLGRLTDGHRVRDDTAYLFLGDYINKGPGSGAVLKCLIDIYAQAENCFFLLGNHETGLEQWSRGEKVAKKPFLDSGLPSLEAAGIGPDDARAFLGRSRDAAILHWGDSRLLASHGGLAAMPESLGKIDGMHFRYGTQGPEFDVDQAWARRVESEIHVPGNIRVQLHGHRNPKNRAIHADTGSYNLEGGVDCGAPLRAVLFNKDRSLFEGRAILIENRDIAAKMPV